MAIKSIEATGKTIDEAKHNALAQLGLSEDEVSMEVLDRGKTGLFGLFGASPARVRVTYGLEEEDPAPAAQPVRPAAAKAVSPAPQSQPGAARPVERTERPEKAERPERKRPAPRAAGMRSEPAAEAFQPAPAMPPEELGPLCGDEKAQKITAFLTGLLEHMESQAQVKVYKPEEGRYKVILEGERLGQLIGRRGRPWTRSSS